MLFATQMRNNPKRKLYIFYVYSKESLRLGNKEITQRQFYTAMLAAIDNLNDSVAELKNSASSSKSKNQEKNKVMNNNKNLVGVHAKNPIFMLEPK